MIEGQGLDLLVPVVVEGERGATWSGSFLLDQGFIVGMECSVLRVLLVLGKKQTKKQEKALKTHEDR